MLLGRLLLVLGVLALGTGCDRKSPVAPSGPPPPAVTSLVITGADAVLTGLSATYTATATLSDGATQTGTTTWSSSNPFVATVDAAGRLEGRAHGSTTVTATYIGRSASKTVQVVNNYAGTWVGRYVVNACDGFPGWCADTEWAAFSITLEVSQTGSDQSQISARFRLPSAFPVEMRATIGGSVTLDGRLKLAGSSDLTERSGRIWATFRVDGWDTKLSGLDAMTGGWEHQLTGVPAARPPFTGNQQNELVTMTRTSTSFLQRSSIQ